MTSTTESLEEYVLVSLMRLPDKNLAYLLDEGDFSVPAYKDLYVSIRKMLDEGKIVDERILLNPEIAGSEAVKSHPNLITLMKQKDIDSSMVDRFRDLARMSDLKFYAKELAGMYEQIKNGTTKTKEDCTNALVVAVDKLVARHKWDEEITVGEGILRALKKARESREKKRFETGIPSLDYYLYGGLITGEYVILAARTSIGKSLFTLLPALKAGENGQTVLIASNEMSIEAIAMRMLAHRSGVDMGIAEGYVNGQKEDYEAMAYAQSEMSAMPIVIMENCYRLADLRNTLRKRKQFGSPVSLVIVDLAGRMKPEGTSAKSEVERLTEVSKALQAIPKEFDCTVIALVQISREGERSGDITLINLKGTGSWEEDADKVFLMSRDKKDKDLRNLELAKNRNGKAGAVFKLRMNGSKMALIDETDKNDID